MRFGRDRPHDLRKRAGTLVAVASLVAASWVCAEDAPSAEGSRTIEEIVVTAEKRESNLQETPIALSAFGTERLANLQINSAADLQTLVPTLVMGEATGETAIAIRGVSHEFNTAGGEPGVALNVDGVNYTQSFVAPLVFYDVRSVEVLRGPQGTLYGRNTTGGAINVTSQAPSTDAIEAEIAAGAGRFDDADARGFVTTPLGEWGGVRIAGLYQDRGGYMTNLADGSRTGRGPILGGKAALELTPLSGLTVTLRADRVENHRDGATIKLLESRSVQGLPVPPPGQSRVARDPWELYADLPGAFDDLETKGGSGTAVWETGLFTVRSITAYRENEHHFLYDIDGTDDPESSYLSLTRTSPFTQEVNVFGAIGPFTWLVGAFYLDEDLSADLDAAIVTNAAGPFLHFRFRQESRSVAGFSQASYSITDWLRITLGGRYTADEKEVSQQVSFPPQNDCTEPARFRRSWQEFTPKAGVDVIATDDLFFYGTVSRGYKAGGFNLTTCGDDFDPEKITAYEGGVKSRLFDDRLSVALTGFYYDYTDFQANLFINAANEIVNAASAKVKGVELETTWLPPIPGVTLDANGGFLDAEFDKLAAPNSFEPLSGPQDLAGNRVPRAPKLTASIGATYEATPFEVSRLVLHVQHKYSDEFFFDIFNDPVARQGAYDQTDATVTLGTPAEGPLLGGWELAAYVRNIENEAVLISAIPTISVFGVLGEYAAPRTYGFRLTKRFS